MTGTRLAVMEGLGLQVLDHGLDVEADGRLYGSEERQGALQRVVLRSHGPAQFLLELFAPLCSSSRPSVARCRIVARRLS